MVKYIKYLFVLSFSFYLVACSSEHDKQLEVGAEIYKGTCKVCHALGINGAPVYGNKKNWAPRASQGIDVLVQHASNGYGLMPAKGGNDTLTDDQLRSAITYMLEAVKE